MWPDLLRLIITILIFAAMAIAGLIAPRANEHAPEMNDVTPAAGAPPKSGAMRAELETLGAAEALPALAQQLMDALPADSSVWGRYLSGRAVFVGEGEVLSKTELLKDFGPFPPGFKGSIKVKNPRITEFGDVAVMVFDAMEEMTIHGQHIAVHYLDVHLAPRSRMLARDCRADQRGGEGSARAADRHARLGGTWAHTSCRASAAFAWSDAATRSLAAARQGAGVADCRRRQRVRGCREQSRNSPRVRHRSERQRGPHGGAAQIRGSVVAARGMTSC